MSDAARDGSLADRSMALGLRALSRLARTELVDRAGLRGPSQRLLRDASREGFRSAAAAGRAFTAARKLASPARQRASRPPDRFDLTPTDEQQMVRDSFREFAGERLRPAAEQADADASPPAELLAQSVELGAPILGVPEELGGAIGERSAVTSVLAAEALAHGDMGLALACLAPAAVATALGLWGDADQQARYVPPFSGDDPPAAALALLEPGALFDPFRLSTSAHPVAGGFRLDGVKALVPRARDAELLIVGAELETRGPALFVIESGTEGVSVEPEPAMGLRAAATGQVALEDVKLPRGALLGAARPEVYAECVQRARLGWCALALGTCQAVLDHVSEYVNQRVAFGEPISHRQAVAFAVADIAIELEGMRLVTYRAAALADREKPFARVAAQARDLVARHGMEIGSQGIQLLGGHGYVKDHPVERFYRDLRAAGLMEGALLV